MTPDADLPEWIKSALALVLGAGGVAFFRVWLENRRLAKQEYRDTLMDRIRELERMYDSLHEELADERVKNAELRARLGICETDHGGEVRPESPR